MLLMKEIGHDLITKCASDRFTGRRLPAGATATVAFTGGTDPIPPKPFRIGTAGAATVAAAGLAAARLWEQRTGRRQPTASLRSGHYMKLGDGELSA